MVYRLLMALYLSTVAASSVHAAAPLDIVSSYAFLVSDVKDGGVLYTTTAGSLKGLSLPLSFRDSAEYWGMHVCRFPARECAVTDRYNPADYSLSPDKGASGDLQTERVNTHNGANIYDAATWQIAVTLGQVRNGFKSGVQLEGYHLASNQNRLLSEGHGGNATDPVRGTNRATTKGSVFRYDGETIRNPAMAFSFRMLGKSWLSDDPFLGTRFASLINASDLPPTNPAYASGKISWTDWKPVTGENAWAFLLGPLHSATLYYREERKGLKQDESAMLEALQTLRLDQYPQAEFPGKPNQLSALVNLKTTPYLYASRRYFIPFGWFANPLPSTCATAWAIMIANHYDPFGIGGAPN